MKIILKIIGILLLGAIGGIISQIFLIPYLMKTPFFEELEFIKSLKREIVINPTEEIIIKESEALEKAVEKVEATVFNLSFDKEEGCGFCLTSDGQVLTQASLLPQGDSIFLDGEKTDFRILKRDLKLDLALIKIEASNLKTMPFFEFEKLKIGTSVFLIDPDTVVNQGIVKSFSENSIETNILEKENFSGCPLFTFEGKFLGLSRISEEGEVSAIPVSEIRSFAGL